MACAGVKVPIVIVLAPAVCAVSTMLPVGAVEDVLASCIFTTVLNEVPATTVVGFVRPSVVAMTGAPVTTTFVELETALL